MRINYKCIIYIQRYMYINRVIVMIMSQTKIINQLYTDIIQYITHNAEVIFL